MADLQNQKRGRDFRERVTFFMKLAGLPVQVPKHQKPSDAIVNPITPTSIQGIDDFAILTRAEVRTRPYEALSAAREAADDNGSRYAAVILNRPDKDLGESYAVMQLSDFTALLAEREGVR